MDPACGNCMPFVSGVGDERERRLSKQCGGTCEKVRLYPSIDGVFETAPINCTFPRPYNYLVTVHKEIGATTHLDVCCWCIPPDTDSYFAHDFHFTLDALTVSKLCSVQLALRLQNASMSIEVSGSRLWSLAVTCLWPSGVGLIIGSAYLSIPALCCVAWCQGNCLLSCVSLHFHHTHGNQCLVAFQ